VHLVSDGNPERPWTGRITEISAAADSNNTGAIEARVLMAASDVWRPGTQGEAAIEVGRTTLFGALWWKLRQLVRGDVLL
jgi:hypothetical protein